MIAYLNGRLAGKKQTEVIIDIGGIGYRVLIPTSTYESLPAEGGQVRLFTYHYVREDTVALYGFDTETARTVFEKMISVSGIGPKLALAVLSAMRPSELQSSILHGDETMLVRIPGVGKKTAQRMVIELRDKLAGLVPGPDARLTSSDKNTVHEDALAALMTLGLTRVAAEKKIQTALRATEDIKTAEELTRLALRA